VKAKNKDSMSIGSDEAASKEDADSASKKGEANGGEILTEIVREVEKEVVEAVGGEIAKELGEQVKVVGGEMAKELGEQVADVLNPKPPE